MRDAVRQSMASQTVDQTSASVRDDDGDTIFAIDVAAEDVLLPFCEQWGREETFLLLAEGIEAEGRVFGEGPLQFRLLADPIDGTRGLMFDKRVAWSLAGIAPDRGEATSLADVELAVMTELPTTRQPVSDCLWATRGGGTRGRREDLLTGAVTDLRVVPSSATDLLHGFATVNNFFQGGKEMTARIEERLLELERGGWNHEKAEIYCDQYICSGGQLAELALGRDRFVMDVRPLVHRALGVESTLCCRPYDLCAALVAEEAGCVVTAPDGSPLAPPLDVTTNVGFVGYCNRALAARLQPLVERVLRDEGLL